MSDHHDSARLPFQALQQTDFLRLEHAAYLKGLLKPCKGKGALEDWANQCFALRDDMRSEGETSVPQSRIHTSYPDFGLQTQGSNPNDRQAERSDSSHTYR